MHLEIIIVLTVILSGSWVLIRYWFDTSFLARPGNNPETDSSNDTATSELEALPTVDHVPGPKARIRHLLQENEGILRQQQIVDADTWSAPTVSRQLTAMEDEGTIERYPLGREKIVYFPEAVPAEADEITPGLPTDPQRTRGSQ